MPAPIIAGGLAAVGAVLLGVIGNGLQLFMQLPQALKYLVFLALLFGLNWGIDIGGQNYSVGGFLFIPVTESIKFLSTSVLHHTILFTFAEFTALCVVMILVLFAITLDNSPMPNRGYRTGGR